MLTKFRAAFTHLFPHIFLNHLIYNWQ